MLVMCYGNDAVENVIKFRGNDNSDLARGAIAGSIIVGQRELLTLGEAI